MSETKWCNFTRKRGDREELIRVNLSASEIERTGTDQIMIRLETDPVSSNDIDKYLKSLDDIEDDLRVALLKIPGCVHIIAITGANYRDHIFYYRGAIEVLEKPVSELKSKYTDRLTSTIKEPDWKLFDQLKSKIDRPTT